MSTLHSKAAAAFLADADKATWHDATFWALRDKRDGMARGLGEWERLREAADAIKRHTLSHLDTYLGRFAESAERNGATVHWAKDAAEFNSIVLGILQEAGVKKMVKSKSMLTEECEIAADAPEAQPHSDARHTHQARGGGPTLRARAWQREGQL